MLNSALVAWLTQHADALHTGEASASHSLLQQLGQAGVFRQGVPIAVGGLGNSIAHAIETIAALAEYSLTAAFVTWSQRTYIEYLLSAKSEQLAQFNFDGLLAGDYAGATGLSNAMKFLSGLEPLQVEAEAVQGGWRLSGKLPWVTNFQANGFTVAVAADSAQGPLLFLVPSDRMGFNRLADLDLIGLRGSSTAAAILTDVFVTETDVLSVQAKRYLAAIRPVFLALQCGLSIGLIRRSIQQIRAKKHAVLIKDQVEYIEQRLAHNLHVLYHGLSTGEFVEQARQLFEIRINLSDLTQQAIQLELCSTGGKCYLRHYEDGFSRRLQESAFIPIVTPSVLQLKTELSRQAIEDTQNEPNIINRSTA